MALGDLRWWVHPTFFERSATNILTFPFNFWSNPLLTQFPANKEKPKIVKYMESFIFFIFLSPILLSTEAAKSTPSTVKCSGSSIGIRFPFRIKPEHSGHRRHAGFELHCKENHTVIHFPSQGDLVVKSISYDDKRLDLLDPKRCVHEVFLNLNLSDTPFDYYHTLKKYTYLKCSAKLPPPLQPVPCLSGSGYHVYTVDPRLAEQVSCMVIKTVGIPFPYSSYLSDNSFGLRLTWDLPGLQSELGWRARCYHKSHPTGNSLVFIFIFYLKNIFPVLQTEIIISIIC